MRKKLIYPVMLVFLLGLVSFAAPVSSIDGDQPTNPDSNHASAWQSWLHDGSTCDKVLDEDADSYTLGEAPEGFEWSLIVINAGKPGPGRSDVTLDPEPREYENEQTGDVSNVILCKRETQELNTAEFSVVKDVQGEGDTPADPFEFSWDCNGHSGTFNLLDDETFNSGVLEFTGDKLDCEVKETKTHDADSVSNSKDDTTTADFTLTNGENPTITFTNVFNPEEEIPEEPEEPEQPEQPEEPEDEEVTEDEDGDVLGDRFAADDQEGEVLGQVIAPTGGVRAGAGGAAGIALSSLFGMGGSLSALGIGALRLLRGKDRF